MLSSKSHMEMLCKPAHKESIPCLYVTSVANSSPGFVCPAADRAKLLTGLLDSGAPQAEGGADSLTLWPAWP